MYEFNLTLDLPFNAAMEKLRNALMDEHLGIVSEVDVQAVFKKKMDKDIPPYRILGACNPKLAERVLEKQQNAGTLLPCNFVVRSSTPDQTVISFLEPNAVLDLTGDEDISSVGREARAMLDRVLARLS